MNCRAAGFSKCAFGCVTGSDSRQFLPELVHEPHSHREQSHGAGLVAGGQRGGHKIEKCSDSQPHLWGGGGGGGGEGGEGGGEGIIG